jgi:hypothetical protein
MLMADVGVEVVKDQDDDHGHQRDCDQRDGDSDDKANGRWTTLRRSAGYWLLISPPGLHRPPSIPQGPSVARSGQSGVRLLPRDQALLRPLPICDPRAPPAGARGADGVDLGRGDEAVGGLRTRGCWGARGGRPSLPGERPGATGGQLGCSLGCRRPVKPLGNRDLNHPGPLPIVPEVDLAFLIDLGSYAPGPPSSVRARVGLKPPGPQASGRYVRVKRAGAPPPAAPPAPRSPARTCATRRPCRPRV